MKKKVVDSDDKHAEMLAQRTSAMLRQCELDIFGGTHTVMEKRDMLAEAIGCVDFTDKKTLLQWLEKRTRMEKRR